MRFYMPSWVELRSRKPGSHGAACGTEGSASRTCYAPARPFREPAPGPDPQGHGNAPDDEYTVILFHFANDVGSEATLGDIYLARLQRAAESAHHSTSGRGDHVIDGGCMRDSEGGGATLPNLRYIDLHRVTTTPPDPEAL